ncbi:MAG: DUF1232 domain-containing protein [Clostridia bacterium]|nr:DUF1232 domain-containing protein [Clostridia bacterium]
MTKKEGSFTERIAEEELRSGCSEAEEILGSSDRFERLMLRLEKRLRAVPKIGGALSEIPVLISLARSYVSGVYREPPVGSVVAIVSALLYFAKPLDIIPDVIPALGLMDDALVIGVCLKLVQTDVQAYQRWRDSREPDYTVR